MIVHKGNFMDQSVTDQSVPELRDVVGPVVDKLNQLASTVFNFLSPQQAPLLDKASLDKKIEHCSKPSHFMQNIFVCGVGAIIMLSVVLHR